MNEQREGGSGFDSPETSETIEFAPIRQEVLVAVSVVLNVPTEFEALQEALERISAPLLQALEEVAAAHPGVQPTTCVSYHYLNDPETNARRCEECGRWTTDPNLPEAISALPDGGQKAHEYLCYECMDWRTVKAEAVQRQQAQNLTSTD